MTSPSSSLTAPYVVVAVAAAVVVAAAAAVVAAVVAAVAASVAAAVVTSVAVPQTRITIPERVFQNIKMCDRRK
jgi:hypothetical protein